MSVVWVLLMTAATAAVPRYDAPPTPRWLYDITRVAYTDLPNGVKNAEWPDKVIADLGAAGVQMMFSRVHNGADAPGLYWKSAFGEPWAGMGDRDGTRDVVRLCHANHIRYLAYYWAQYEPPALGEAHPDWRMRYAGGKPVGNFYCHNTGYHELVKSRCVELVNEVGVDGIFFDMFHAMGGACYCDACKAKFRAETGQDPPAKEEFGNPLWVQWRDFQFRKIETALLDINRAIKAANPDAALTCNSWNAWCYRNPGMLRQSERVAEVVDGLLEETGWYDTVDPSFFAGPLHMSFMNWHLAGLCKATRAFMWGAPSLPGWLQLGYEEPAARVATMLTNGAVPAHSVPGRDVLTRLMQDVKAREKYFLGAKVHPWCGLVVSEKSELWYGRDDPKGRYVKGVYGAFQAMTERHLPVALVTDRELETGLRDDYKVLFLPNCASLSEVEMQTLREFVRKGGGLVATYETSLYDEYGRPRDDLGLGDLLNAKKVGSFEDPVMYGGGWSPNRRGYLYFAPKHPWTTDPVVRRTLETRSVWDPAANTVSHVPFHGRMLLVEPRAGAPSTLLLHTAITDPATKKTETANHPAVVESTFGQGKALYLPADVSWSFFRYGHEYLGRLMELALRQAAPEPPPVEIEAPSIVQAMPHVQGNRLVVHLLNDCSSYGRGQNQAGEQLYVRREVIPIQDIRVTFRGAGWKRFVLVPGEKPLKAERTPQGARVTVPKLELHCMVVGER
ncbi:MAG: beta-galactosidase trimerization domain-containing protein [Armatimonadetes bacterium]|nr:beta-galactosidase trimerization domain-containing protein [Armatimonadota bacterium]